MLKRQILNTNKEIQHSFKINCVIEIDKSRIAKSSKFSNIRTAASLSYRMSMQIYIYNNITKIKMDFDIIIMM